MGFVFSYAAIQRGEIPTTTGIVMTRDEIIEKFRLLANAGVVEFAGIYGSVIPDRGDHTNRSDMDVFLIYPDSRKKKARQLMRDVRMIGHKHNVVVNARLVPHHSVKDGSHPYGPSFRGMWKSLHAQGMLIGDPAKLEALLSVPRGRTVRHEIESKVHRMLRRAVRHAREFAEQDKLHPRNPDHACDSALRKCVRPLHVYLNLARKLLLWEDGRLDDHAKRVVLKEFGDRDAFVTMHAPFRALKALDREYDKLLEKALAKEVDKADYRNALYDIMVRTFEENLTLLKAAVIYMQAARKQPSGNGKTSHDTSVHGKQSARRSRRDRQKAATI